MSRIGDYIITLEEKGEIYYDESAGTYKHRTRERDARRSSQGGREAEASKQSASTDVSDEAKNR